MANNYRVHYAKGLADKGKTVEWAMWDKRAAAMGHRYPFIGNPAQCRDRGAVLEYTTDPAKVTCLKCATIVATSKAVAS